jgi:hypothetical protein
MHVTLNDWFPGPKSPPYNGALGIFFSVISLCLDPLLKSDFTDFYAENAFCKKS